MGDRCAGVGNLDVLVADDALIVQDAAILGNDVAAVACPRQRCFIPP